MIDYYYDNVFLQPPEPREIPDYYFDDFVDDEENAENWHKSFIVNQAYPVLFEHALVRHSYYQTKQTEIELLNIIKKFNCAIENRVEELVMKKLEQGFEL
ncbi:Uncharacterised protein [[Actinobacillus] rossii]|uniref:Uncharacterized protein n=1 Tax=[Actinobacillus] rossii TaxID=123820 RepID=A0A376BF07_9PAST|nr:Uncharacterised protein [[Actinobacillus] rossii]